MQRKTRHLLYEPLRSGPGHELGEAQVRRHESEKTSIWELEKLYIFPPVSRAPAFVA